MKHFFTLLLLCAVVLPFVASAQDLAGHYDPSDAASAWLDRQLTEHMDVRKLQQMLTK